MQPAQATPFWWCTRHKKKHNNKKTNRQLNHGHGGVPCTKGPLVSVGPRVLELRDTSKVRAVKIATDMNIADILTKCYKPHELIRMLKICGIA